MKATMSRFWTLYVFIFSFCTFLSTLQLCGGTVTVDLFESQNHQDLSQTIELEDSNDCANLKYGQKTVSSVNSHGGCVILHKELDCKGQSQRIAPDVHSHNNLGVWNFDDVTLSIGSCSSKEQSISNKKPPELGLYSGKWQKEKDLLFEASDVCGCRDLPPSAQRKTVSVNTHGSCYKLYESSGCSGSDITLDPTSSSHGNLENLNFANKAVSFSGCGDFDKCAKLKVVIFETKFPADVTDRIKKASKKKVEMQASLRVTNNSTNTLTKEVKASKTITTRFEMEKVQALTNVDRVSVDISTTAGGKAGVPFVAEGSWELTVAAGYGHEWSSTEQTRVLNATESSKTFEVTDSVSVSPCTEQTIETFVNVLEGFPIEYEMYMKVTGSNNGRPLRALVVRDKLPQDMIYIRDHDDQTVIAKTIAKMRAHAGIDSGTYTFSKKIPNCISE